METCNEYIYEIDVKMSKSGGTISLMKETDGEYISDILYFTYDNKDDIESVEPYRNNDRLFLGATWNDLVLKGTGFDNRLKKNLYMYNISDNSRIYTTRDLVEEIGYTYINKVYTVKTFEEVIQVVKAVLYITRMSYMLKNSVSVLYSTLYVA